jgi:hypothetical protein
MNPLLFEIVGLCVKGDTLDFMAELDRGKIEFVDFIGLSPKV